MRVLILILIPALIVSFVWHIGLLGANRHLNQAESLKSSLKYEEAFAEYEEALGNPTLDPYIRYRYGLTAQDYVKNSRYFGGEINNNFIERAIELQEDNMAQEWPAFTRNHVVRGRLANLIGDGGLAIESFREALEMSPHRPSLYLDLANSQDIARAGELIDKSLDMNRMSNQAHWALTLLRVKQGRVDEAQAMYPQLHELGFPLFSYENLRDLVLVLEEAGYEGRAEHFRNMIRHTYLGI